MRKGPELGLKCDNYRFSHDVTKIYTKEISILLSFYRYEVLQQLNIFIYTKFWFKRVLCFAIFQAFV